MLRCLLPLLLLGLSFSVHAGEKKIVLFNGKDLTGWVAEGNIEFSDPKDKSKKVKVWSVQNGAIHCQGKGFGFLRYDKKAFADFHFHVEYRMVNPADKRNNSGIGIRTVKFDPKRSRDTRPSFACYEIQLLNDVNAKPDTHSTGSLYRYVAPKINAIKPAPAWNTMDIYCNGPKIRIVLNGKEILDFDQTTLDRVKNNPLQGYVCLQNHGSTIEFRNVWIEELTAKSE